VQILHVKIYDGEAFKLSLADKSMYAKAANALYLHSWDNSHRSERRGVLYGFAKKCDCAVGLNA
jgi:hypothetical protein